MMPDVCSECGYDQARDTSDPYWPNPSEMRQDVECMRCMHEWTLVYTFDRNEELKE